jgi:hypothetical protein
MRPAGVFQRAGLTGTEQVQTSLDVLMEKPLWSSGRAADLERFAFGDRRTVKGYRGGTKEVDHTLSTLGLLILQRLQPQRPELADRLN